MINNVITSGPWLQGNASNSLPYISGTPNPMQGVIRLVNGRYEALDGNYWISIGSNSAHIDMTSLAKDVLDWANKKMHEEQRLEELAKTNPTIADLVQTHRETESKLKMALILADQTK